MDRHHALRSFAACDPSGRLVVGVANTGGEAIATALQLGQHGAPLAGGAEAWVLEAGGGGGLLDESARGYERPTDPALRARRSSHRLLV